MTHVIEEVGEPDLVLVQTDPRGRWQDPSTAGVRVALQRTGLGLEVLDSHPRTL